MGVHHAGVLPKYRRIVEDLFQRKLLSVAVCTETLSAGINLPARSVVLPNILKGPPGKKRVLESSTAHQIFGRAGRPQFDTQGYVFVLAHEDDVKIARWREKYDQIPEDTKDPGLLKAKKDLKRKMPKRRDTEQYWNEAQFEKLRAAQPGKLYSQGPLPWRLLGLHARRLARGGPDPQAGGQAADGQRRIEAGQRELDRMLMTLWRAGYVTLEPEPPRGRGSERGAAGRRRRSAGDPASRRLPVSDDPDRACPPTMTSGRSRPHNRATAPPRIPAADPSRPPTAALPADPGQAHARVARLLLFRGVNPLYGMFLVNQLGIANRQERIQAMESVLELPRSVGHFVRVPRHDRMPPGPLATIRLDPQLLQLGLATAEELVAAPRATTSDRRRSSFDEPPKRVLTLAESCACCSTTISPASTTCARSRSGRPASCWSSAATSTSTSPARACRSRKG